MKAVTLIFILLFNHATYASGDEDGAVENIAIQHVLLGIDIYHATHNAKYPTNWTQLSEAMMLDRVNQDLRSAQSPVYPLQEHYVFIPAGTVIPAPGSEQGDVILIRTSAVNRPIVGMEERKGRPFVSVYHGVLKYKWLTEDNIQKMLASAGVTQLPQPEPMRLETNASAAPQPGVQMELESHAQSSNPALPPTHHLVANSNSLVMQTGSGSEPDKPPERWAAQWGILAATCMFILGTGLLIYRRNRQP